MKIRKNKGKIVMKSKNSGVEIYSDYLGKYVSQRSQRRKEEREMKKVKKQRKKYLILITGNKMF